jgi:FkbM family methyltransferase
VGTQVSQFGEAQEILSLFPPDFNGVAVDVGASDGVSISNTFELEQKGWTVLCVEPNYHYLPSLRANRKLVHSCAIAEFNDDHTPFHIYRNTLVGENNWEVGSALYPDPLILAQHEYLAPTLEVSRVRVRMLDTLLEDVGLTRVDVLSVDVEGGENAVFRGFDLEKWHPKVIVLEQFGYADGFCRGILSSFGYELYKVLGKVNYIYVSARLT